MTAPSHAALGSARPARVLGACRLPSLARPPAAATFHRSHTIWRALHYCARAYENRTGDTHTDTQTRHWRPGPASQRRLRWRCRPIPSLATRIRTCVGRIRTQREPPEERGTLSLRQPHPHTLRRSQKRCSDPSQSRKWVALSHTTRASTSESHTGQKSASTEPYSQPCIPCVSQSPGLDVFT